MDHFCPHTGFTRPAFLGKFSQRAAFLARSPLRSDPGRGYALTPPSESCSYSATMDQSQSFGKPVEVEVRDSLEKAMKILKQKMSKEGILQELKRRRFYEKPSVKRKRKMREARKRLRREMKRRVPQR